MDAVCSPRRAPLTWDTSLAPSLGCYPSIPATPAPGPLPDPPALSLRSHLTSSGPCNRTTPLLQVPGQPLSAARRLHILTCPPGPAQRLLWTLPVAAPPHFPTRPRPSPASLSQSSGELSSCFPGLTHTCSCIRTHKYTPVRVRAHTHFCLESSSLPSCVRSSVFITFPQVFHLGGFRDPCSLWTVRTSAGVA